MVKSNAAKRNARLDKSFSNNEGEEDWSRPYVSRYNPGQRFMITITKKEQDECPGIDLVEFKRKRSSEIYVTDVDRGPFYETGRFIYFKAGC
jgi:hypothetical protein